ncbi:MAG: MFS transporter [Burkholderiales bacterium]|nr:MFS transporter [Burkholderiales bacterium]
MTKPLGNKENKENKENTNGYKIWLPTIGLAFAAFVFNTSEFLPIGLLPNIAESLHETDSQTGLVITVYAWVVALMSLPLTILTAKLERRKLLIALLIIFAASHLVVLAVNSFVQLMGARICVALTHSIFWSIMTPLAARTAPMGKMATGLAAVSGGSILATILGVPLGTQLGYLAGWRESFFIIGIVALIVLVYIFYFLPECKSDRAGSLKSVPILFRRPGLVQLYVLTAIVILGHFTAYSYISPLLINEGGLTESATVSVLFVFGTAGIVGVVAGAKTAVRFKSATIVLPMIAMTLCLALLTSLCTHCTLLL